MRARYLLLPPNFRDRRFPWACLTIGLIGIMLEGQVIAQSPLAAQSLTEALVVPAIVSANLLQEEQQQEPADRDQRSNFRRPDTEQELQYWVRNMQAHGFNRYEMAAATGLPTSRFSDAAAQDPPQRDAIRELASIAGSKALILPYPGGRHPRIGFLDGAIRPQRETKFSLFAPWEDGGYVVADTPEAIWWEPDESPKLLYLAHTHIPTTWDRRDIELEPLEWQRHDEGGLSYTRRLPNGIEFGATVEPADDGASMELWLTNGIEQTLRGLRVQNCVMLKAASGFNAQTAENKVFRSPYAVCHNEEQTRWVITAWEHCDRAWGNVECPCLHSDPQFPDCPPGETLKLRGWLSFYEGKDIDAELSRLAALGWHSKP